RRSHTSSTGHRGRTLQEDTALHRRGRDELPFERADLTRTVVEVERPLFEFEHGHIGGHTWLERADLFRCIEYLRRSRGHTGNHLLEWHPEMQELGHWYQHAGGSAVWRSPDVGRNRIREPAQFRGLLRDFPRVVRRAELAIRPDAALLQLENLRQHLVGLFAVGAKQVGVSI